MRAERENFHPNQQSTPLPIWREVGLLKEWSQLKTSPLWAGKNIPRGMGAAVVTIPGFMCSDLYISCLRNWLQRIGYQSRPSSIERNNDCIENVQCQLLATIEKAATESNSKVHLIGHSLGGVLARIVAIQRPELIASVVTLASPFRGIRAHPYVLWLGRRVQQTLQREDAPQCFTGFCSCPSVAALHCHWPASIPVQAIFTRTDGIVDWQACITDNPLYNAEVSGTHVGLVFNQQVYQLIAAWLKKTSFETK